MKDKSKLPNPFPGLRSFRSDEDYLFFGREEQTLELVARLQRNRFIAVVGSSGQGKSSLVRCGLLSRLQGGGMVEAGAHWEIAVMHPGGDPLRHLAQALLEAGLHDGAEENALPHLLATLGRSQFGLIQAVRQAALPAGSNFLLVVDQFEEIFRYDEAGETESEVANDFIAMLREAAAQTEVPIYIVATMRSDFIGDCSRFEGLAEAVNRGEYLIPRLTREQFKSAIEGPIRVAGGQIAPRLLQRLLNDLGEEQDQLPCLQHALMRTWRVWQDRADAAALDLEDYAQVGKMSQALSVHADEVYLGLATDRQRELCAAMFKALTVEGSEKRGIRRPRRLQTLCKILGVEKAELLPVIEAFRHPDVSFLVPPSDVELRETTVVDLSHESLMRVWTRLREWVDDEAKSVGIFRRLSESATLWRQGKSGFYRDPELSIARAWMETSRPNAAWAEQYDGNFEEATAFLQASTAAAEKETRDQEAARQRELEQAKALAEAERARAEQQTHFAARLKWFVRGLGLVALVAVGAMFLAFAARREAQEKANIARQAETKAEATGAMADKARTQAEKLANFLLDDFYEDLATTAGLEMVGALAERAVAYYDGLPPELRTPETQRSRTLAQLRRGVALRAEGDYERGMPMIDDSLAEFQRMHRAGDTSDATIIGLVLALQARSGNPSIGPTQVMTPLLQATDLLRPLAMRPTASPQLKLRFARLVSTVTSGMVASGVARPRVEEARPILVSLGALDLSNLHAASTYAHVLEWSAVFETIPEKREQGLRDAIALAEKVIALRPSDLNAVRTRARAFRTLATEVGKRFDYAGELELRVKADRAFEQLVRLDPSRISARDEFISARLAVAYAHAHSGRIIEGLATARSVIPIAREQRTNLESMGGLANAYAELSGLLASLGDIPAADQALAESEELQQRQAAARGVATTNTGVEIQRTVSEGRRRFIRMCAGDYPAVIASLPPFLTRIEALWPRLGSTAAQTKRAMQRQRLEAIRNAAESHIHLGQFAEAEALLAGAKERDDVSDPEIAARNEGTKSWLWLTCLARAIAGQGRRAEAATIIDPVVAQRRAERSRGADDVNFRLNFSQALFVQALAQPDDARGRAEARKHLSEAEQILRGMTKEAQTISFVRVMAHDIATAQAKLGRG